MYSWFKQILIPQTDMKKIIKKLTPTFLNRIYHYSLAIIGSTIYRFPSDKMIVIGVTGTKGKTSTINFIWSTLSAGGFKTGIISTANIRIGDKESLNKYHMTMPGRFEIQKLMSEMTTEGCKYCIVETTSEGIKQCRNVGINYDILVFTNLFPEHLPSHGGSFENYKNTKVKIFKNLQNKKNKVINGKSIEKVSIVNNDSEHAIFFSKYKVDKNLSFSINNDSDYKATDIQNTNTGVGFKIAQEPFNIKILGKFNVYNALPAIIISYLAGISKESIKKGLNDLKTIPGRMEIINEGQNFTVIVDYAHEKESMTNLLQTANSIKKAGSKTIVVLGAEGGGRDKAKRPLMGEISAKLADYVVVTNVDPYDDEPKPIIEDIAVVCEKFGKIRGQNLFTIEDRKSGIRKALTLASADDIVLITGKGAEQSMIIGGKSIPWDDRMVVQNELKSLKQ